MGSFDPAFAYNIHFSSVHSERSLLAKNLCQLKVEDMVYREESEKSKGEGGRVCIREIEGL